MTKRINWKGFMPAVVTPFDERGNLDEDALRQMLALLIEDGVSGVVMLGDNGEGWSLSDDEKKRVFKIAVEEGSGKVTVIGTTTGKYHEKKVIELTKYAKDISMDGVMLHAPFWAITERETVGFYKRISEVGIPMLLYNIPYKQPVDLHADLLKKLANEVYNFVAVKESDRDFWHLTDKIKLLGDEISFFVGPCTLIFPGLLLGAVGYVATSPEFLGKGCEDMIEFIKDKEIEKAIELHYKLCDSYKVLNDRTLGAWQAILKYELNLLGKPAGFPRRPIQPLNEDQKRIVKQRMEEIGFL